MEEATGKASSLFTTVGRMVGGKLKTPDGHQAVYMREELVQREGKPRKVEIQRRAPGSSCA